VKKYVNCSNDIILSLSEDRSIEFKDELLKKLADIVLLKNYEFIHFTDYYCQYNWSDKYLNTSPKKYEFEHIKILK